jgi:omega-hydroxy-beta-dihydromenaquinone-9 sulfotransferase
MRVTKPVFIVGTGRCGSTAFHRMLGAHPQFMWLSGFAEEFPNRPSWNRWAVTAMGNPVLRRIFGAVIKPGENYGFWYTHAYGFAEPGRDLLGADVTPPVKKQVHAVIERMLTPKRSRMLVKLTGWSRIGFLNEIFEDAKFVHIVRDGRAVASSLLHINSWQWRGWYGPYSWRYGPLSPEDQA